MTPSIMLVLALAVSALHRIHGQEIPIDIAYLADDANDESFARSFIPKYFTNTLNLIQSKADRDRIRVTLNVVRTDQVIDRSVVEELNKKAALYMGDYDDNFVKSGYFRPRTVPYVLTGRSGFVNYLQSNGKRNDELRLTCTRSVTDDVMSFFPPRIALAHLLIQACPEYFMKVVLIGENAFELNLILEALHAFRSQCFDVSTFIIDRSWSKEKGMKILRNALKLRPDVIAIYSFKMNYVINIFKMAQEANMLTFQHTWFLMHPDILGIPEDMDQLLRKTYANVTGIQIISRENFRLFGLEPPRDHIIKHSSILDVMIKLSGAIRDHLAAGKSARVTSSVFMDWVKAKKWQGYEDTIGYFTDRIENINKPSMFCRESFKITYYTYEGGIMHKVRASNTDDYYGYPKSAKPTAMAAKDRVSKQYVIAGFDKREKRQAPDTKARVVVIPENETAQPPIPFRYWRQAPKEMPLFYKNNIRAVAILTPPMVMEKDVGGKVEYRGMMVDYLKHYSNTLKVNYTIDKVVNNRRELYLALDSGMYDVGIGSLGMSGIRYKQTDYTDTVRLGRISLLTRKAAVKSYPWQFLQPFTWAVWISLGVVFILTSILLTVMDILDWTDESFPVRDSFYYTAGLLCNGSTDTTPATVPSRLMICCLMFFAIVVSNSYTANMTAFLTMRKSEDLPQTLQALAAATAINYSYVKDSEIYRIFTDNDNDPYGAIVNRRKTKAIPLFNTIEDAIDKVVEKDEKGQEKKYNMILITEEYTANYYASKECNLEVVLQPSEPIYYTIMLPFGATYREQLNEAILEVREGYKDVDTVDSYYEKKDCSSGDEVAANSKTRRLKWNEMVGVFYVLMMGALLAIIVGVIGEVYVKFVLKKERKRQPWKDFKAECRNKISALRSICGPPSGRKSKN